MSGGTSGVLSEPRRVGSSGRLAPGNTCRVQGCRRQLVESFNQVSIG